MYGLNMSPIQLEVLSISNHSAHALRFDGSLCRFTCSSSTSTLLTTYSSNEAVVLNRPDTDSKDPRAQKC